MAEQYEAEVMIDGYRVTREDLPDCLHDLVDKIGLPAVIELHQFFGGGTIYFQQLGAIVRHSRNREIQTRYNGANAGDLAREYGMTERNVRYIVGE